MYYNRILRVRVVDVSDIFLLSVLLGSIAASYLKDYFSEKKAMKRLKKSVIKESELLSKQDKPISNSKRSKQERIKKIYKFALEDRGGQFKDFQQDLEFSDEGFKLAHEIKKVVERLACFLKERELKGVAKIFFKNGRSLLELILYKCKIDITYALLTEGLSTQVIVITATAGGTLGFTVSLFSVEASLVAPPVLISYLFIRSVAQQIVNQRDYSNFKKLVNRMLEDDELKKTLRVFFMENEIPNTSGIKMKPFYPDKNLLPEFDFESGQTFEEFIKNRMKEQLGLVENPTQEQIEEIIHRRPRPKGKTVYFKDFIKELGQNQNDIIDVKIVNEPIEVKIRNEEL